MLFMNKEKIIQESYLPHVVRKVVTGKKAYFVNIADLHMGLSHRTLFQATVAFLLTIPNLFFGLGGDSTNCATRVSKGNVKEETLTGNKQLFALAEDLKPVVEAGRLLYIIDGNHGAGRMKDLTYDTPEETLAHLLGRPDLYKRELAILYLSVNGNVYTHYVSHKSPKKEEHFAWVGADTVWREHTHQYKAISHLVMEHDKNAGNPIIKEMWEVYSGTYQIMPSYSKMAGYRIGLPGCYIMEMSGEKDEWKQIPWRDDHLFNAIINGYKVA